MKFNRIKLALVSAIGTAALAAPGAASADVNVSVGSANVLIPLRNCERAAAETPDSQTITVPEIRVPVTVGPIIPELGTVTVNIGGEESQVPIGGDGVDITVQPGVDERGATTPPRAGAEGPESTQVDQTVTLPASANLLGADTPETVAASSCKAQETTVPEQPTQPEQPTEPTQPEQPQTQPEQPQAQPEAPAAAQETPAQQTTTSSTPSQSRPATTGQDTAKKAKQSKAKKKAKSKKKSKKGKAKAKKGKKKNKNRRR